MTRDELEKRNVGENLDALMNLDPRGYGVCRILYAGSRAFTGEPLTMHAAQVLCDSIKENDLVYILVGFVLLPHKVPEMDGTVSAMLLARALVMAFNAKLSSSARLTVCRPSRNAPLSWGCISTRIWTPCRSCP